MHGMRKDFDKDFRDDVCTWRLLCCRFRNWDKDGDGAVTRDELHEALPALGLNLTEERIDKLFDEWNESGDGRLTYQEVSKVMRRCFEPTSKPKTPPRLKSLLNMGAAFASNAE